MKTKYFVSAMVLVGLFLFATSNGAWADVYLESEQVSQGMPGQLQDSTTLVKHYLTTNATMTDMGERITIINFKEKILYDLDSLTKTYTKSPIEKMGMPAGKSDEMANNPMFKAMMKSMTQSAKVTPTNETKKIEGYKCKKYLVNIMMAQSDYWVSKDVKGLDEMKEIGEKSIKLFEANPMMKQTNILGMMKDLDGYPVQTVTRIMGGTMINTLKKVETKKLDKDLFKVPKGYKLVKEGE